MKYTIWNIDLFHDPNENYGTFEKLLVNATDRHFDAKTLIVLGTKYRLGPQPEFYGPFNSGTEFIEIFSQLRPIQLCTTS